MLPAQMTDTCTVCKEQGIQGLKFAAVQGHPVICERCMCDRLGLGRLEWSDEFATVLRDVQTFQPWWERVWRWGSAVRT